MSLKFYTQKKYLASKFSSQKKYELAPQIILIYSIRQTLDLKKEVTDLLTQKNTEGVNF